MTPPPTDVQVAAFLKRRVGIFRWVKRAPLLGMVIWYRKVAGLGIMRVDGKIVAVAQARCVRSIEQAMADQWAHDEETGRIIWVENIASLHPDGIRVLLAQAGRRFGQREAFAGQVFSRSGELRMLPWNVVARLTQDIKDHGLSTDISRA